MLDYAHGTSGPDGIVFRRARRLCFALLILVAGTFTYCILGVRLLQWWTGSSFLYDVHEAAVLDVPFWLGTSAIVLLLVFSIVMRSIGRWQHEWFIVLCAGAVAWLGIVFTMTVVAGLIEF